MSVEMLTLPDREAWLKRRAATIGGSDAGAILGLHPYMSNIDLYEIKAGIRQAEDISDKDAVKYGQQAERYLRGLFRLDYPQYRVEYVDNNMWLNDRFPWAHYSADGWLYDEAGRLGILEIKTTEIKHPSQWAQWIGRVPDHYFAQVLHGMMVMEAEFAVLKAQIKRWIDDELVIQVKHYFFERASYGNDISILEKEEIDFALCLRNHTRPALLLPEV